MTICNKIQTLGETMETNLNARGVSCTFGTGTGESTVLDMVEMVNGTNFKGSSDVNLKIGANKPYLLSGESTDVVVKLENGLCEPLKNKNVTIEQSLFRDDGTTASHNDHWYINSYGTATVQTDGTKLLNTSGNTSFVMRNIVPSNKTITEPNAYSYNPPYIVEFDIVETDGTSNSNAQVQIYSSQTTDNFAQAVTTGHYKIEVTSEEQKIWVDDTLIKTTNLSLPNARITLRARNGKYLIYKNFKVYETIDGVTDEKGEFALYNVSVTDDTTFTATYGTETATCLVEYCNFVDYGTTSKHNDNWTLTTNMQRTRNDSYTTLSNIGSTSQMAYPISSTTNFSGDITIEWENYATTYQLNYLIIRGTSDTAKTFGALGINKVCNVKITVVGTSVKSYINGVQKDSYTINRDANNQFQVRLRINPNGDNIKYKNFRIR